jgi:hypothetical protein
MAKQAARKIHVPKRIAGVKVPKPIRKGPVADFIGSQSGQALAAEILVVVGAALLAKRNDPDSAIGQFLQNPMGHLRAAGQSAAARAGDAKASVQDDAGRLVHALSEAIQAFRTAMGPNGNGATRGVQVGDDEDVVRIEEDGDFADYGRHDRKKNEPTGRTSTTTEFP